MSHAHPRKTPRFFVINPVNDRRTEVRFASAQKIFINDEESDQQMTAVGHDIGRRGMKIDSQFRLNPEDHVQVLFPDAHDAIRCFGRIVWTRRKEEGSGFVSGLEIESWHGIVAGPESWKNIKGSQPIRERRRQSR